MDRMKIEDNDLGTGMRLEVTVQAASLADAHYIAKESRHLDPSFLFSEEAGDLQLLTHTATKERIFADFDALRDLVEELSIITGRHEKQSTQFQRQVIVDLFNALGWHPGQRPTQLDNPSAWWKSDIAANTIAQRLEGFKSAASCKRLFEHIRLHLPCQKCKRVGTYQLNGGKNTFRIKCQQHCKATLGSQKFRTHLSWLVQHGQLGVDIDAHCKPA